MVKGSLSEALVVIGDGSGCSIGVVGVELQELHAQFLIRRYSAARTLRMNPTRTTIAHIDIARPTICYVASTHGIWILGSRARILVHIRKRCQGRDASEGRCGIVE